MGGLCSKESRPNDYDKNNNELNESAILVVAPSRNGGKVIIDVVNVNNNDGSVRLSKDNEESKTRIMERPKDGYKRQWTMDMKSNGGRQQHVIVSPNIGLPGGTQGEQIVAGWPSWLTSVAGEAIQGWVPRSAESFHKFNKIGQGTYSSVYKARDLKTNKIVAMKKVRFVNMDPESVRFMAREIYILRKLDHPNVMKLEALVTSRISESLYLVFEYMEHDLAGLAASPKIKFSEPQIKCYMKQLLLGLEHCHSRGILHRDIKGSNLLVDDNGVLKIADFGLANFFGAEQKNPLTSRVVTLWYRAPELLLGATEYGVAIDMWSVGCILAELSAGKPIMPGRTEVEQMHKIFKLCGSPSEEYWSTSKLPHATSFKPQRCYKRCVSEIFKDFPPSTLALVDVLLSIEPDKRGSATTALNSEFFTTDPLPCDPSNLTKYPPSKELDAKLRDEEARRRKAEGNVVPESKKSKGVPTPESASQVQEQSNKRIYVYTQAGGGGTEDFPIEPPRVVVKNGYVQSNSVIHPSAVGYARIKKGFGDGDPTGSGRTWGSALRDPQFVRQRSHMPVATIDPSREEHKKDDKGFSAKENGFQGYESKRNRILCSGPLVPNGANVDDMLKEHERLIQEAVRKARINQNGTNVDDMKEHERLIQEAVCKARINQT